jgi:hypothetical protein
MLLRSKSDVYDAQNKLVKIAATKLLSFLVDFFTLVWHPNV